MKYYNIILLLLAVIILLSAFAEKRKLPSSIVLIVAGITAGFIPSLPPVTLRPDIIFLIFLPPLLYEASFNISFNEFRTQIRTISTLGIGLVFITAIGIGLVAYVLIPGMTYPLAFVLGAILSATDAVAAIGITKALGLPHKTLTILEGESLINDASALVAYKFAVAAVTGTSFVLWKAGLEFMKLLGGGILVGFLIGYILAFVLKHLKEYGVIVNSLLLLMPFITYLWAEEFHVSGVIAVVVLGLSMSRLSRARFPDQIRKQSHNIWEIFVFLLNGLIFLLIGLAFPMILKSIPHNQIVPNLFYALIITIVALIIRTMRVFWQKLQLQRGHNSTRFRISKDALLDAGTSLVISWAGMRGIVSLAMAIGLPVMLIDGEAFPLRSTIIFITTGVVLFTIVGQGLLLPLIVKKVQGVKPRIAG